MHTLITMSDLSKNVGSAINNDTKPKVFDEQGAIGKQFTGSETDKGALGGTAEKVGGPFDKDGMIGKQFTTEGSIGGSVQNTVGGQKKA
ncbi:hypothetical protein HJFPF1_00348 [Paramyrothecium foliicola]|nr:hypothetical protein HJFPF1_00348 [Paramyrothecium foliicola]